MREFAIYHGNHKPLFISKYIVANKWKIYNMNMQTSCHCREKPYLQAQKSVMEKYASTKLMKISQCPHLKSNLIKIYASKVA